ncbi:pilus assembly FimT family protein [Aliidiomarina quisquiliarum]|uniref:pilus assembly FimT family protein n=1 Tax=Aliidiomarina quisquiliarum TaxID=2938947 RepID=UPI00208E580C|nr:GspH/FimT family pseudopilin [Aliidiomarina quisquiliarum]MCO4321578.1 GspH/FimT family pseudopilin [Aliidiomarina quisquiliarum]
MLVSKPTLSKQQGGFTLIEVLLVVAIIGIAALVIVLQLPASQQGETTSDARREFQLKFHYAREQALLRNWVIGVEFKDDSYGFYRWHEAKWQEFTEKPLLRVHLKENMELDFIPGEFRLFDNLANKDTLFTSEPARERSDSETDEPLPKPQVIIFESTEFIPFKLQWLSFAPNSGGGNAYRTVQIDGSDGIQLRLVEDQLW